MGKGTKTVLVVDDDISTLKMVEQFLALKKYDVTPCLTYRDATKEMAEGKFDAAILDYFMPDTTGLEMMKAFHQIDPAMPVIILTAARDIKIAVTAIKEGAFNYQVKPVDPDELYGNLSNAIETKRLTTENLRLKNDLTERHRFDSIIGSSGKMNEVYDMTARASKVKSTVLITGETGSGKELVAKAVHYNSDRKDGPFIRVNCAATPEGLLEAELFGIEKNVATGVDARMGKFEAANGGTIFLDEIGDMPLATQAKVLRVMQEREVERIGSHEPTKINIRILAATHKDLEKAIEEGVFRNDLYYRLNVLVIHLPALKERKEDIYELAEHFVKKLSGENGISAKTLGSAVREKLLAYDWPGNVRELENCIERALVVSDGGEINPASLPVSVRTHSPAFFSMPDEPVGNLEDAVAEFEKIQIMASLERNGWRQNKAAEEMGVTERSMWYKIKKYGIDTKKMKTEKE